MALYIKTTGYRQREWHIGEVLNQNLAIESIVSIQADGDELDYIAYRFNTNKNGGTYSAASYTIPMPVGESGYPLRVVTWWGDIAKTIVANL